MIEIMPSDVRKVFEHLNKQVECSDDGMDHNDLSCTNYVIRPLSQSTRQRVRPSPPPG